MASEKSTEGLKSLPKGSASDRPRHTSLYLSLSIYIDKILIVLLHMDAFFVQYQRQKHADAR